MERRKFVIGLGSLAAGGAAATGTGAFSAMTADRQAEIDVVDDTDGLVSLTPQGEQVELRGSELAIDTSMGHDDGESYGVNVNSVYQFGKTEDGTWDPDNFDPASAGGYVEDEDEDGDIADSGFAEWYGTHYSNGSEVKTDRTFGDIPDDGSNVVSEPLFTVQNNDTQPHDIVLTIDEEIASVLGEGVDFDFELEFQEVDPGEVVDIALVVLAGNDTVSPSGAITVSAD